MNIFAVLLIVGFFSWMALDLQAATKLANKREKEREAEDPTEDIY